MFRLSLPRLSHAMFSRLRTAIAPTAAAEASTPKAGAPLSLEEKAAAVRAGVADLLTDAPSLAFVDGPCARRYLAARGGSVSKAVKALRCVVLSTAGGGWGWGGGGGLPVGGGGGGGAGPRERERAGVESQFATCPPPRRAPPPAH